MLKSGPLINNKRGPFILNPLYLYLDTCSTFNQNINNNIIHDIQTVVRGIKSQSNRGLNRTNHKGKYGGLLGYLETWFQKDGMGYILSFDKVKKFL